MLQDLLLVALAAAGALVDIFAPNEAAAEFRKILQNDERMQH